jgi:hypothetical protein
MVHTSMVVWESMWLRRLLVRALGADSFRMATGKGVRFVFLSDWLRRIRAVDPALLGNGETALLGIGERVNKEAGA